MQDVTKVVLNHDVQTKPLCRAPVCNAARMDRRNHCKQRKMPLSSHQKFITLKNFNEGIKFWRETYWPRDFHNQFAAGVALRRDFPYACKIAEICLIGRHQRRLASRS
jgi:hypothetical protein